MTVTQRNADDIRKMLANFIIENIYTYTSMDLNDDWMQIGPITEECQNELRLLFGSVFDIVKTVNIIGYFKNLKARIVDINMNETSVAVEITHAELIQFVEIAIKYRIPIKDFYEGVEKNWNLDNF